MFLCCLSILFNTATRKRSEGPALLLGSILMAGSESLLCVGGSSADLIACNAVGASDDSGVYQDTIAELLNIVGISQENLHTEIFPHWSAFLKT